MAQKRRLEKILDWLQVHHEINAEDIITQFNVSRDTARRDLVKLEEEGKILRVKGGAVLASQSTALSPYRDRGMPRYKEEIARKAAAYVREHDHIFFDTSTTVELTARLMANKEITAVTNSIDIFQILSERDGYITYLTGGKFNKFHRNFTSFHTAGEVTKYKTDVLFLGACGLGMEGLTSPDEGEAYVKKSMIQSAKKVILLADHTKFNKEFLHQVCDLSQIDLIITDQTPPKQMEQKLRSLHIELMVTEKERGR
ncbi:DeoR/GlpR family DNA-binding transcription regulator [Fictibacillus terranigra]|uniref:DeoR/GlpR family DNA-binding transcription regulator n=1 Tax=Fictibacillus terranigra TaxID=3058424 RepID=A0ABT8E1M4_9BACL|nr:DeoR/GlpR family DNA-binding transcription regulator [Fictibacillus sp. CENA-BCM004]MDN4071804.1 DeoR/GlpR family DNA-binding transcription regulator [Fictibacillus sp. CENA-BCM004]